MSNSGQHSKVAINLTEETLTNVYQLSTFVWLMTRSFLAAHRRAWTPIWGRLRTVETSRWSTNRGGRDSTYGQSWRVDGRAVVCRALWAFGVSCRCCCHRHTEERRHVRTSGRSHTSPCTRCSPPNSAEKKKLDNMCHLLITKESVLIKTLSWSEAWARLTVPSCSHPLPQKEPRSGSDVLVGLHWILWQQWWVRLAAAPPPPGLRFDFQTQPPPRSGGSQPGGCPRAAEHRRKYRNLGQDQQNHTPHHSLTETASCSGVSV